MAPSGCSCPSLWVLMPLLRSTPPTASQRGAAFLQRELTLAQLPRLLSRDAFAARFEKQVAAAPSTEERPCPCGGATAGHRTLL